MRAISALALLAIFSCTTAALAEAPANTIMKVTPPGEAKPAGMDPAILCTHKIRAQMAQLGGLQ